MMAELKTDSDKLDLQFQRCLEKEVPRQTWLIKTQGILIKQK